jgi:hypothetical protein
MKNDWETHDPKEVMFKKHADPYAVLWCFVLQAQMSGAKAGDKRCKQFFFSKHCTIICQFLNLNVETLQQASSDLTPMKEPTNLIYYSGAAYSRERYLNSLQAIEAGWTTGPEALEVQHVP